MQLYASKCQYYIQYYHAIIHIQMSYHLIQISILCPVKCNVIANENLIVHYWYAIGPTLHYVKIRQCTTQISFTPVLHDKHPNVNV